MLQEPSDRAHGSRARREWSEGQIRSGGVAQVRVRGNLSRIPDTTLSIGDALPTAHHGGRSFLGVTLRIL